MANAKQTQDFIVFADDWGVHPSSCQHLFQRIAREHRVLWVNTIMRLPALSFTDVKKVYTKLFSNPSGAPTPSPLNLHVVRPLLIPVFNPFFRKINKAMLLYQLKTFLYQKQFRDCILVTTLPIVADIVEALPVKKVVYYCVDEFAEWMGHHRQQMQEMEAALLAKSDMVIATSTTLYEAKKPRAKSICYLPHGVDVEHFQTTSKKKSLGLPHPLLGYYGLFDERNDLELIEWLLQQKPSWHIVIIGKVACDVTKLQKYPNITFWGTVPYSDLPQYVRDFDVCILPYRLDKLTEFINPLKFKEYLATGLPVVTTALSSLKEYDDVIGWSETSQQFLKYLDHFLAHEAPLDRNKRLITSQHYLERQSWEEKAQEFLAYIVGTKKFSP